MSIASKYNPSVAWRTLAKDVFQLTRETENAPATYRMTVKAIDTNDVGANQKEIGFYAVDFWGVPYLVIGTGSTYVDVEDSFRVKRCPTSGLMAVIYKSVYNGRAMYLGADNFRHLHPLALNNSRRYDMALIWANDPNAKKVPFLAKDVPIISNYQTDQEDPEDETKTINYQDDFGDTPNVRCIRVESETVEYQLQIMPQFTRVDGKIDTIWFWPGDVIDGRIIISRS